MLREHLSLLCFVARGEELAEVFRIEYGWLRSEELVMLHDSPLLLLIGYDLVSHLLVWRKLLPQMAH